MDEKFLRGLSHGILKNLSEIASFQIAALCHIFHGNREGVILFNEADGLLGVKLRKFAALGLAPGGGAF